MAILRAHSFGASFGFGYNPPEPGIDYYGGGSNWLSTVGGRLEFGVKVAAGNSPWEKYWIQSSFAAKSEIYVQICEKTGVGVSNDYRWITFRAGTTELVVAKLKTDESIDFYRGDPDVGGVLLGSTSIDTLRIDGVFAYYEFRVKIDGSAGVVKMRKDGFEVFSFTGNTKPGAETTIDNIRTYNTPPGMIYSDFIINDTLGSYNNSWPGGAHVEFIKPDAAGAVTEWLPSSGSNYQCVDEFLPSASDYVTTDIPNVVDVYNLASIDGSAIVVSAIIPMYHIHYDGDPQTKYYQRVLRAGTTNYTSASRLAPASTMTLDSWEVLETNPATGAPFTVSEINNLQLGLKAVTS